VLTIDEFAEYLKISSPAFTGWLRTGKCLAKRLVGIGGSAAKLLTDGLTGNLRRADQTWKVRLIEEEFGRLMFDVKDVYR